jgi:hypothetical protein
MRRAKDERGTVAIEAAFALLTISTAFAIGLSLVYYGFARIWIERSAYEAAICVAREESRSRNQSRSRCTSELRQSLSRALPIGTISRAQITFSSSRVVVESDFKISSELTVRAKQDLWLPLKSGSAHVNESDPKIQAKETHIQGLIQFLGAR